jgi:hypothetical protein
MIASFLHLPMYAGHFGYPKNFPKKNTNVIHTQTPPKTTNKQKKTKTQRKEKDLEYTTTDLFKYRVMKARTYARALAVGRAIQ